MSKTSLTKLHTFYQKVNIYSKEIVYRIRYLGKRLNHKYHNNSTIKYLEQIIYAISTSETSKQLHT